MREVCDRSSGFGDLLGGGGVGGYIVIRSKSTAPIHSRLYFSFAPALHGALGRCCFQ